MRPFASAAAVAFAIANLYLLYLTGPLVSPSHQLVFHLPGSATVLFVPAILDLAALSLVLTLLLLRAEMHPRAELLLYSLLLLPLPAVLLGTAAAFAGRPANPWLLGGAVAVAAAAFVFIATRLRWIVPAFARARLPLQGGLRFLSLGGLVILGHLLWDGWQCRALNPPFVPTPASATVVSTVAFGKASPPPPPRVVWLILDELSYRQVFSNRPPGLSLPNFDRLAGASAVFTAATAAAEYTRVAVPSLLTGLPLTATDPTADGRHLLLHPRGARRWQTLDPADTVFADAKKKGLPTGIAGWYEPYCRLLPTVVDRCFWTYSDDLPAGLAPGGSILSNSLGPLRVAGQGAGWLREALGGGALDRAGGEDVRRHRADFRALAAAGDSMLQRQQSGLLLLHMPIPHPWGFYDRRTGTFPPHRTSYLDNLALADLYLGHLRALMEADGSWDRTNLIVMGDHGWRTEAVWRRSGFWTGEEERASRNLTSGDRPAVLLKLAGQTSPARLDTPFAADRTRALIDAVLAGSLHTTGDLKGWIAGPHP